MNIDDIKKGLECCSNPRLSSCNNCPYNNNGEFSCRDGEMCKDALNLITEQEKEIERLKDDYAKLQELFAQYQMASDKEIIAQKKQAEKRFENNMKAVLEIEKKHAVQDFAEKVKEKYSLYDDRHILYRIIDELLKEYEE